MNGKEYNPAEIEGFIQKSWKKNNSYKASPSPTKEKVLLLVNVSISFWKITYGTCSKLYDWRCNF
jgi:hypothetical protein